MKHDEALKVLDIAATLAAGAISEEQKGTSEAIAAAFREAITLVIEELDTLSPSRS